MMKMKILPWGLKLECIIWSIPCTIIIKYYFEQKTLLKYDVYASILLGTI